MSDIGRRVKTIEEPEREIRIADRPEIQIVPKREEAPIPVKLPAPVEQPVEV